MQYGYRVLEFCSRLKEYSFRVFVYGPSIIVIGYWNFFFQILENGSTVFKYDARVLEYGTGVLEYSSRFL